MIEVRNLVKCHGPLRVLDGVSLAVRRGEVAVVVARAWPMKPEACGSDERPGALAPRRAGEVRRVIAERAAAGQTRVVVTHAMGFARRVAHTVHVMHAGRVVESGPPAQVFDAPR